MFFLSCKSLFLLLKRSNQSPTSTNHNSFLFTRLTKWSNMSSFNVLGDENNDITSSGPQPPASLQRRLSYNLNIKNSDAARNVEAAAAKDLEENNNTGAESPPPSRPAPRPIGSIKRKKNLGSTENVARTLAQVRVRIKGRLSIRWWRSSYSCQIAVNTPTLYVLFQPTPTPLPRSSYFLSPYLNWSRRNQA